MCGGGDFIFIFFQSLISSFFRKFLKENCNKYFTFEYEFDMYIRGPYTLPPYVYSI